MSTDERISLLERYVLSADKEVFFSTLVKNLDTYTKMRLLDSVNRYGLDVPADVAPDLKKFLDNRDNRRSLVAFKSRLLELERDASGANAAEAARLLDKFNDDYLQCRLQQYGRPPNVRDAKSTAAQDARDDSGKAHLALAEWDLDACVNAFADKSKAWNEVQLFSDRALPLLKLDAMLDKDDACLQHVLAAEAQSKRSHYQRGVGPLRHTRRWCAIVVLVCPSTFFCFP